MGTASNAQVDFEAARKTREWLVQLSPEERRLIDVALVPAHVTVRELHGELLRGDGALPAPLAAAATALRNGATDTDRSPRSTEELRRLLLACVECLQPLLVEEWEGACRDVLRNGPLPTEIRLSDARNQAAKWLGNFSRRFPSVLESTDSWHQFLCWPLADRLVSGELVTCRELDSLEVRWQNALSVLRDVELREGAHALRTLIPLVRGNLCREEKEAWEQDWTELADLTRDYASGAHPEGNFLLDAIRRRERLGAVSPVTRSVRNHFSRSDLAVEVKWSGLAELFPAEVRQDYPVRGIFAGAPATGSGELIGQVDLQLQPAPLTAKWFLTFEGESLADTTSFQDRVRIDATSKTRIYSGTQFTWDQCGLSASPEEWNVAASVRFDRIITSGLPLRQRAAEQRVRARRAWAESDSETSAQELVVEQIDSMTRSWNEAIHAYYVVPIRDRWLATNQLLPDVRIISLADRIIWTCALGTADSLPTRITPRRPISDLSADVTLAISETSFERYFSAAYGGRTLTGETMRHQFFAVGRADPHGPAVPPRDEVWQDMEVTFRDEACRVTFRDGVIQLSFSCERLRLGNTTYPPMQLLVAYRPEFSATSLVLLRDQTPEVRFLDDGGDPARFSGRQQTLRLVAQRRLARLMPAEQVISWKPTILPDGRTLATRPAGMRLSDGWWQAGLGWEIEE